MKILTLPEVAEMTRLSEGTLRWMRHARKGPTSGKLGRRIMYKERDVLDWISGRFLEDELEAIQRRVDLTDAEKVSLTVEAVKRNGDRIAQELDNE